MDKHAVSELLKRAKDANLPKMNFIYIEANACIGNVISFLDADEPSASYVLNQMVNIVYSPMLMKSSGEDACEKFFKALDTDFILGVEGAITTKDNGAYNIFGYYKNRVIPVSEAVSLASKKAKHIIAIGTCASFGGISAARPNPSGCMSLGQFLKQPVINVPGCPHNPLWLIGTIASLILYGSVDVDKKGRPLMFYGETNHKNCERRSYFDRHDVAERLGEKECMFRLGCRGPVTMANCPIERWNCRINWPVGANTPCIGCANEYFPDGMEPFIRY